MIYYSVTNIFTLFILIISLDISFLHSVYHVQQANKHVIPRVWFLMTGIKLTDLSFASFNSLSTLYISIFSSFYEVSNFIKLLFFPLLSNFCLYACISLQRNLCYACCQPNHNAIFIVFYFSYYNFKVIGSGRFVIMELSGTL